MFYHDELIEWLNDLGIEVRLGKRRADLKLVGLHLVNPTVQSLIEACYEALVADDKVNTIIVYIRELV